MKGSSGTHGGSVGAPREESVPWSADRERGGSAVGIPEERPDEADGGWEAALGNLATLLEDA